MYPNIFYLALRYVSKVPEWFQDRKKKLAAGEPLATEENSIDLDFEEERKRILAKLEN